MPRNSPALKLLAVFLLTSAGTAFAQTKPSDAPPKLERIEEGSDTPVTIVPKRDERRKIKEKREGGQVTEVQVTSGKSTYTMKGANPASTTMGNSEGTGSTLRTPQWQVLEFDLSKKKQKQRDEEAAAAAAAAPPAPVPPPPPPAK